MEGGTEVKEIPKSAWAEILADLCRRVLPSQYSIMSSEDYVDVSFPTHDGSGILIPTMNDEPNDLLAFVFDAAYDIGWHAAHATRRKKK